MPTTQLDSAIAFPLRAKKIVSDVAITYRYTSRCGRYLVDSVHWVLHGYPDFWASWYLDTRRASHCNRPFWVRLGHHKKKRTAQNACARHAKRQTAIASN